jgi:hypothetical protein
MPLYFGRGRNRYDDPAGQFGVLYAAFDLPTALMESVFHDHQWHRDTRSIRQSDLSQALVRDIVVADPLTILDLTAPNTMSAVYGLNLGQLASRDYSHTRKIAASAHTDMRIDGILYPSRNNFPATCVALFDRSARHIEPVADIALEQHLHWKYFQELYGVQLADG